MAVATIRDVAREAAVSIASASRALNGHANVTAALRDRVLAAATALDYSPHLGARSLSTSRSNTIGVVLPDLFGGFFSELIRGIDFAARERRLQLLLTNMHGDAAETALALRAMRGRVDGLIVMAPEIDGRLIEDSLPRGLPTILLNGRAPDARHAAIGFDNRAGAEMAVAHLVAQGCRRIVHVAGPVGNADAAARADGYRTALARLRPDCTPVVIAGDFQEDSGTAAAAAIVAMRDVDGVFAANDVMALSCMSGLLAAGIAVPRDIAIIGFDDVPVSRFVTPALSTIGGGIAAMGTRALVRLAEAIAAPDVAPPPPERIAQTLVVRASTDRHSDHDEPATTGSRGL